MSSFTTVVRRINRLVRRINGPKGGTDEAGFVQIRHGVSDDPTRLRDLYVNQQPVRMGPIRPEVIGGLTLGR